MWKVITCTHKWCYNFYYMLTGIIQLIQIENVQFTYTRSSYNAIIPNYQNVTALSTKLCTGINPVSANLFCIVDVDVIFKVVTHVQPSFSESI